MMQLPSARGRGGFRGRGRGAASSAQRAEALKAAEQALDALAARKGAPEFPTTDTQKQIVDPMRIIGAVGETNQWHACVENAQHLQLLRRRTPLYLHSQRPGYSEVARKGLLADSTPKEVLAVVANPNYVPRELTDKSLRLQPEKRRAARGAPSPKKALARPLPSVSRMSAPLRPKLSKRLLRDDDDYIPPADEESTGSDSDDEDHNDDDDGVDENGARKRQASSRATVAPAGPEPNPADDDDDDDSSHADELNEERSGNSDDEDSFQRFSDDDDDAGDDGGSDDE